MTTDGLPESTDSFVRLGGLLLAILLGCVQFHCMEYDDWQAEVSSDTRWRGDFFGLYVEGSGNQTVDLPDNLSGCVVVRKETEEGFLRVTIHNKGSHPTSGDYMSRETRAPYDTVSVCR